MKKLTLTACFLALAFGLTGPAWSGPIRIKDLVEFDGVRGNDLVGYGLVEVERHWRRLAELTLYRGNHV